MSSLPRPEGARFAHLSVDLPIEHAELVARMVKGVGGTQRLSVRPVLPASAPEGLPPLMAEREDEKDRLVLTVERQHIRAFGDFTGDSHRGLPNRLITGIWGMARYTQRSLEAYENWSKVAPCLVGTPILRDVIGLRALEIGRLHHLLSGDHAKIPEIGDHTIEFLGRLSSAVETSVAARPVDNREANL